MQQLLRGGLISLAILTACGVALTGCGRKDSTNAAAASEAANLTSQADKLLAELPDKDRQDILDSHQKSVAAANTAFAEATGAASGGGARDIGRIATYIEGSLNAVDGARQSIADQNDRLERVKVGGMPADFIKKSTLSHQGEIARLMLAIAMRLDFATKAASLDPLLADALKEHSAQPKGADIQPRTYVSIVEKLALVPCRTVSTAAPELGPFSLGGVSLGMTREQAISAACASQKGQVMHVAKPGNFEPRKYLNGSLPQNPIYWADYRAGRSSLLADNRDVEAWAAVAKPKIEPLDFCFNCAADDNRSDAKLYDGLAVGLDPAGKVVYLHRPQRFAKKVINEYGNPVIQWMPRPLNEILSPLKAKFGEPSFVYESGKHTIVSWVYRDRTSPLPLETWYASKRGSTSPVEFKNDGFLYNGPLSPKTTLWAAKPVSSYCASRVAMFPDTIDSRYFTYSTPREAEVERDNYLRKLGPIILSHDKELLAPYNSKSDAAGFVENCGVVITAKLSHLENDRGPSSTKLTGNPRAPDADTPIYFADVIAMDLDAYDKVLMDEAKAAAAFRATRVAAAEKEKKDFNNDPANAYRP